MKSAVDSLLSNAVSKGDVPGVVAVATDAKGTTYEGGFGKRVLGQSAEMTPDTVVWIASMTKAITGAAAMQQVERGKLGLDAPAKEVIPYLGEVQVLEGFDADGKPKTRKPKRDITLAPPAHPHRGLQLRDLESRHHQVPGDDGRAGHHRLREQGADHAADVRSRRALGLRHQHRLGRQDGRGGERQEARPVPQGQCAGPARHGQHRLLHHARHARAAGAHPSSRPRRLAARPTWRSRSRSSRSSRWAAAGSTAPPATTRSSCA